MILIGNKAPLFTAPAVIDGNTIVLSFSLEQFIGKKEVIFFFYPKDFTFVCPTELIAFQNKLKLFEEKNVAVVGCSTDTEETHLAWLNTPRDKGGIQGVTYPIIADTAKTIAVNYGVLGGTWDYNEQEQLFFQGVPVAYRGVFFVDKGGIIRYAAINDLPLGRSVDELLRIVTMWQHVTEHGEVCPANWQEGEVALEATPKGIASYLSAHMNQ